MPSYENKKCCGCFTVSTESGMRGIFAVFVLETAYVLGLTFVEIGKVAPIALFDILLLLPFIFMLLHMILVFRNDSAVQRKKVTKFIMLVFVWTAIISLIQIIWVEKSPQTALSIKNWSGLSEEEKKEALLQKRIRMDFFYVFALVGNVFNFYFYRVSKQWQK